jgi:hypothetical protein
LYAVVVLSYSSLDSTISVWSDLSIPNGIGISSTNPMFAFAGLPYLPEKYGVCVLASLSMSIGIGFVHLPKVHCGATIYLVE